MKLRASIFFLLHFRMTEIPTFCSSFNLSQHIFAISNCIAIVRQCDRKDADVLGLSTAVLIKCVSLFIHMSLSIHLILCTNIMKNLSDAFVLLLYYFCTTFVQLTFSCSLYIEEFKISVVTLMSCYKIS